MLGQQRRFMDAPGRPCSSVTCSTWAGSKTSSSLSFVNVVSLASWRQAILRCSLETGLRRLRLSRVKGQYSIVRNFWREYWGEVGHVRVAFDDLDVESQCAWALVQSYTAAELNNQVHCHEGGDNGGGSGPSPSPSPPSLTPSSCYWASETVPACDFLQSAH